MALLFHPKLKSHEKFFVALIQIKLKRRKMVNFITFDILNFCKDYAVTGNFLFTLTSLIPPISMEERPNRVRRLVTRDG